MTPIEIIALVSVFVIYTSSQHLLNWWWRIEEPKPSYESKLVLVMFGILVSNVSMIVFARWVILTI